MRKFMLLGSVVALVVVALALPALADSRFGGNNQDQQRLEQRFDRWQDQAQQRDYSQEEAYGYYFDRFAHFYGFGDDNNRSNDRNDNNNWWNDGRNNDNSNNDSSNNNDTSPAVSQSNEQEVQSGDATQNISVTGGGDNSNQCAGVQGINNTGNATTNTSVLQYANEGAGVEVDDSGNFTISPSQTTTCDQRVNQAASAFGGR